VKYSPQHFLDVYNYIVLCTHFDCICRVIYMCFTGLHCDLSRCVMSWSNMSWNVYWFTICNMLYWKYWKLCLCHSLLFNDYASVTRLSSDICCGQYSLLEIVLYGKIVWWCMLVKIKITNSLQSCISRNCF
jgi:hypothetical protein